MLFDILLIFGGCFGTTYGVAWLISGRLGDSGQKRAYTIAMWVGLFVATLATQVYNKSRSNSLRSEVAAAQTKAVLATEPKRIEMTAEESSELAATNAPAASEAMDAVEANAAADSDSRDAIQERLDDLEEQRSRLDRSKAEWEQYYDTAVLVTKDQNAALAVKFYPGSMANQLKSCSPPIKQISLINHVTYEYRKEVSSFKAYNSKWGTEEYGLDVSDLPNSRRWILSTLIVKGRKVLITSRGCGSGVVPYVTAIESI